MSIKNTINPSRRGGLATVRRYGIQYMRDIASRGGQAVAETYGSEYMSILGKLGANAVNGHLSKTALLRMQRQLRRILKEVQ